MTYGSGYPQIASRNTTLESDRPLSPNMLQIGFEDIGKEPLISEAFCRVMSGFLALNKGVEFTRDVDTVGVLLRHDEGFLLREVSENL